MEREILVKLKSIARKYDLKLFILFGSRAHNTHKETSDWDFAYFPPKDFSANSDIELFNDLVQIVENDKIDLINLKTTKKLHVASNILQTGTVIYEKKKGFFSQKKWDVWLDLQDFKRYHNWQMQLTKNNLKRMVKNG